MAQKRSNRWDKSAWRRFAEKPDQVEENDLLENEESFEDEIAMQDDFDEETEETEEDGACDEDYGRGIDGESVSEEERKEAVEWVSRRDIGKEIDDGVVGMNVDDKIDRMLTDGIRLQRKGSLK